MITESPVALFQDEPPALCNQTANINEPVAGRAVFQLDHNDLKSLYDTWMLYDPGHRDSRAGCCNLFVYLVFPFYGMTWGMRISPCLPGILLLTVFVSSYNLTSLLLFNESTGTYCFSAIDFRTLSYVWIGSVLEGVQACRCWGRRSVSVRLLFAIRARNLLS